MRTSHGNMRDYKMHQSINTIIVTYATSCDRATLTTTTNGTYIPDVIWSSAVWVKNAMQIYILCMFNLSWQQVLTKIINICMS